MAVKISPSLLSADFGRLAEEIRAAESAGADSLHVDVMDGRFVPNITIGPLVVKAIRKSTKLPLGVHLMIEEPEKYAEAFKKAGADNLTIHIEACRHLHRNIQQIKGLGMKAGVALNPHTRVSALKDVLADIDLVCLMSVNPGFGGQTFILNTIQKIKELKEMINCAGANVLIEIDGGVTLENAPSIIAAGADVLVAGNTVFKSANPAGTITLLKKI